MKWNMDGVGDVWHIKVKKLWGWYRYTWIEIALLHSQVEASITVCAPPQEFGFFLFPSFFIFPFFFLNKILEGLPNCTDWTGRKVYLASDVHPMLDIYIIFGVVLKSIYKHAFFFFSFEAYINLPLTHNIKSWKLIIYPTKASLK